MPTDEKDSTATESETAPAGNGREELAIKHPGASRVVEHFSVAERAARGKATRAEVPRASHGEWEPALHRPDPVELLEESFGVRARGGRLRRRLGMVSAAGVSAHPGEVPSWRDVRWAKS